MLEKEAFLSVLMCCCKKTPGVHVAHCHCPVSLPAETANPKQTALLYSKFSGGAGLPLLKLKGKMKSRMQQFSIWTDTRSHCQAPNWPVLYPQSKGFHAGCRELAATCFCGQCPRHHKGVLLPVHGLETVRARVRMCVPSSRPTPM